MVKQSADNKSSVDSLLGANSVVSEILNKGKSLVGADKNALNSTEEGKALLASVRNTYNAASLDTNLRKLANNNAKKAFKALPP